MLILPYFGHFGVLLGCLSCFEVFSVALLGEFWGGLRRVSGFGGFDCALGLGYSRFAGLGLLVSLSFSSLRFAFALS